MFGLFRKAVSSYYPQPLDEPIGGRPFAPDPIINMKRDAIYACPQMDFLTSQDFFEEVDRRTIMVNGEAITVVTKADFDIVGASLGEAQRHQNTRARRATRVELAHG